MTNPEIAAIILAAYTIPGLLFAWVTWGSKEFGEEIDNFNTAEQVLFVLVNVVFWPVTLLKAVVKYREIRGRKRK